MKQSPRHYLSNLNEDKRLADCSVCGPESEIVFISKKFRCKNKRMQEQKKYYEANKDGWHVRYPRKPSNVISMPDGFSYTREQKDKLFADQNGLCLICKKYMTKPNYDHDHETLIGRALLCGPCNCMLGFAKDNQDTLMAGIQYLQKFSAQTVDNLAAG